MKVNGIKKQIRNMEKENKHGKMEAFMKVIGKMILQTVEVD
jgi:imidazoleglycerol phosphate dehydratase HisB